MTDAEDNRRMEIAIKGAHRLISINDAVARGHTKLRMDHWANPDDYMEFMIIDGQLGPWVKLWSPANDIVGHKNPHVMLILELGDLDDPCWRMLPKELVRR